MNSSQCIKNCDCQLPNQSGILLKIPLSCSAWEQNAQQQQKLKFMNNVEQSKNQNKQNVYKMCDHSEMCCDQLEAEALTSNEQLLTFDVRSKDIKWHEYVTPLRLRAPAVYLQRQFSLVSNYREPVGDHNRREVLVCHDMMGNYLEDRHYHSSKKFDDYRFYHWSGIDYFCYFSHKYITIPPCGWLNAAHKHGVPVLGTFIAEGSQGSQLLHEILQSQEMVKNVVDALVRVCKHYNFEGWLVNVECKVAADKMDNLCYFVEQLKTVVEFEVKHGAVFWYDSVIEGGALNWQNEINENNVRFFRASDAMLINYNWNDRSLEKTLATCEAERAPCQRAFFGIDIFGRGQTAKFQSKQTLARIVKYRFSTGIFAPGWTYETLSQFGYDIRTPLGDDSTNAAFLLRNEKFWYSLWDHFATHPYRQLPFYTDFCLGSGKCTYPSVPLHQLAERHYDDAFNGGSCLRIVHFDSSFRLFVTDFQFQNRGLVFAYAYKLSPRDGEFDCILRFCTGNNARDCYLFLGDYYDTVSLQRGRCYVSPFKPKYNEVISGPLESAQIPKDMAFPDLAANGWRTRYYVVAFDGPVQVKDIGVLYRRTPEAQDSAYLGAVFINECDVNTLDFPLDSNIALIQVYGTDLLN